MSGSISSRNQSALAAAEHNYWRTLLTSPAEVPTFSSTSAILITPATSRLTSDTSPSFSDYFESAPEGLYTTYAMHDVEIVELGMMAGLISYRLEAVRKGEAGGTVYRAHVVSTWLQGADAEWTLCSHQETPC